MEAALLKILASLAFGVAAALFVLAAQRLVQGSPRGQGGYGGDSMRRAEMRRRALRSSVLFQIALPLIGVLAALVQRMSPQALRDYVRGPYARAGYPGGLDDDEVVATGLALGLCLVLFIGFSAVVLAGPWLAWTGLLGLPLGFLGLVSSLKTRAELRQMQMLRSLPYVLDLIVLILRSGTTLGIAISRVVEDYREHPLGDELGQVLAEMNMGAPRPEAFKAMADRLKITDITALTDSIVQSEELGWPLAETLERLGDHLSTERELRAQARAGAAGVWVMLPSTLVLMSAVLLLFGPVIVRLARGEFSMH